MSQSRIPESLRQQIARRSPRRCSYCLNQQDVSGISLTVDHIIPESLGGATTLDNLCFCCWDCNLLKWNQVAATDPQTKQVVRLFHPNQHKWAEHFRWSQDATRIMGKTSIGRATVIALKLNRIVLIEARRRWAEAGWHPPQN